VEGKKQNLKMKDSIQTDTSEERSFLDSLGFDTSIRINSIEDGELRSDIISAVMEIPIIYNMLRNDRLYAKDLPKNNEGRIEVDIASPHILENMDFFRERALYFKKYGKYTDLIPNRFPSSRYMKFWREEQRRCREGLVRESDGEWIPGYYYWYLNYCPILMTQDVPTSSEDLENQIGNIRADRVEDFPRVWDSDYLWYHYVEQAEQRGMHCVNIKTRGRGFSFKGSSKSTRNYYHFKRSKSFAIASEGEYLYDDGILSKAWDTLNFIDNYTPWRKSRDYADRNDHKRASYRDPKTNTEKGIRSEILGVTTKGQPERARGKRGKLLLFEEAGKFPHLKKTYAIARPSVEQGKMTFGTIIVWGTGGTEGADFSGIKELFTKPGAYNIYGLKNIYDRNAPSTSTCGYYCGEYMNREGCYDKNGNSDIVKALVEVFIARKIIATSTDDPNALIQEKADRSITPQEAMMRKEGHIFNVEDMKVHLSEVETNPKKFTDATWKVKLYFQEGDVKFKLSDNSPIRQFPVMDMKDLTSCVEIFEHPILLDGHIQPNVYVAGCDPYDDDMSLGPSLGSILIMNRLTGRLVAEYTGRPRTAEEFYEICYRLMKYYNARCNYENNKKGMFQYFDRINATYMLCDTPNILKDMQITKRVGYGNFAKGTHTTKAVNGWRNSLIRSWLMEQAYGKEEGERNYSTIISPAMLRELIAYDPNVGNYDRISALGMVLIYRVDLEKFSIEGESFVDSGDNRKQIDPFFLKNRRSMSQRFIPMEGDENRINIRKRIRRR
jgi:hypothetical protein